LNKQTAGDVMCSYPIFEVVDIENIYLWNVKINGPTSTINMNVLFPENYPFRAPKFILLSQINHTCISRNGTIHIINDIEWSPALTAGSCLLIIAISLFPVDWEAKASEERQINRTDRIKRELIDATFSRMSNSYIDE
jgi:ubiquitin-protein ligase